MHVSVPLWVVAAIGIPVIFTLGSGFVKAYIVSNKPEAKEFYLGIDLSLAAFCAALVHGLTFQDTTSRHFASDYFTEQTIALHPAVCAIIVTLFLLSTVISTHRRHERKPLNPKWEKLILGVFCNGLGIAAIFFVEYIFSLAEHFLR